MLAEGKDAMANARLVKMPCPNGIEAPQSGAQPREASGDVEAMKNKKAAPVLGRRRLG